MSAAVLYGDGLLSDVGAWKLLPPEWGWLELERAARDLEVETVFYLRAGDDAGLEAEPPASSTSVTAELTGTEPAAWRWQLSTGLEVVDVAADVSGQAGPFEGLDARQLVDILSTLSRVLGVSWRSSVGRTAERLILSTHPRDRGGVLLDRGTSLPEPLTVGSLELPYVAWRRELTRHELVDAPHRWVHVFDANAQYLAAWITAELGHGQAAHHDAPRFDARSAGVWRVPGLEDVPLLVDEWLPRPALPGREWFTTPTLARVWELAHPADLPEIAEAWLWPRRSRFLRAAGERIRDARAGASAEIKRAAAAIAAAETEHDGDAAVGRLVRADVGLEAVKALYRVGTGRFAMPRAQQGAPWYRPDWAHTIRAQARTNLHRRLCKLTAHPFAIATDALAFISDEPEPFTFAGKAGVPIGDKLGEFHHAGSAPALAVDVLTDGGLEHGRTGRIMAAVGAAELEGATS